MIYTQRFIEQKLSATLQNMKNRVNPYVSHKLFSRWLQF